MAAPNIVNVATITGITTFKAGINTEVLLVCQSSLPTLLLVEKY